MDDARKSTQAGTTQGNSNYETLSTNKFESNPYGKMGGASSSFNGKSIHANNDLIFS